MNVANLPAVSGDLNCVFQISGRNLKPSGAVRKSDNNVECTTPPVTNLPPIKEGEHELVSILSIAVGNGPILAATNFTFFDCSTYSSCSECTGGPHPCDWCPESGICSHNSADDCPQQKLINGLTNAGQSVRRGPDLCPKIVPLTDDDVEILVPSGTQMQISVKMENYMEFYRAFTCRWVIGGVVVEKPATIRGDQLDCEAFTFQYFDAQPKLEIPFSILWDRQRPLDNPKKIRVVVYKCQRLALNCGQCLQLNETFKCGWCQGRGECSTKDSCPADWLDSTQTCPSPKIEDFSPKSGPVEGGTLLTVQGYNLGRTIDQLKDAIAVNGVQCEVLDDLYIPSTRIVCKTGPTKMQKIQNGPVSIRTKPGDAKYEYATDTPFR